MEYDKQGCGIPTVTHYITNILKERDLLKNHIREAIPFVDELRIIIENAHGSGYGEMITWLQKSREFLERL